MDALAAGIIPHVKDSIFIKGLPGEADYKNIKGYAYQGSHDIGPVTGFTNAATVMSMLKNEPGRFFPFEIRDREGLPGVIKEGQTLDLIGPREGGLRVDIKVGPVEVGGGNRVLIVNETPTQFTFQTQPGHFDGPNNLISFRTYEKGGRVYLEQTAWAPNAGVLNAAVASPIAQAITWPAQADNLRNAVRLADPIQILTPAH